MTLGSKLRFARRIDYGHQFSSLDKFKFNTVFHFILSQLFFFFLLDYRTVYAARNLEGLLNVLLVIVPAQTWYKSLNWQLFFLLLAG